MTLLQKCVCCQHLKNAVHDSVHVGSLAIPSPQCHRPPFWGQTAFPLLIYIIILIKLPLFLLLWTDSSLGQFSWLPSYALWLYPWFHPPAPTRRG